MMYECSGVLCFEKTNLHYYHLSAKLRNIEVVTHNRTVNRHMGIWDDGCMFWCVAL